MRSGPGVRSNADIAETVTAVVVMMVLVVVVKYARRSGGATAKGVRAERKRLGAFDPAGGCGVAVTAVRTECCACRRRGGRSGAVGSGVAIRALRHLSEGDDQDACHMRYMNCTAKKRSFVNVTRVTRQNEL